MYRCSVLIQVAVECLSFHVSAPVDEVEDLVVAQIPLSNQLHLHKFVFNDAALPDADTLKACLRFVLIGTSISDADTLKACLRFVFIDAFLPDTDMLKACLRFVFIDIVLPDADTQSLSQVCLH